MEPRLDVVEHDLEVAKVTSVGGWKFLTLDTGAYLLSAAIAPLG